MFTNEICCITLVNQTSNLIYLCQLHLTVVMKFLAKNVINIHNFDELSQYDKGRFSSCVDLTKIYKMMYSV